MGHFTTRTGFVLGLAFAVLLVIPLWGAFGTFGAEEGAHVEGGHEGHGAMPGMATAVQEFVHKTREFVAGNTRPDGCVEPAARPMEADHMEEREHHREHEPQPRMEQHGEEAGAPVVYLQVFQFGYLPQKLCLKSGQIYEFRMMATDVIHGASIQLGPGSRMVRLPPGLEVAKHISFTEPGEYLLYCSYYCGVGHQFMNARILVEAAPEHEGESMRKHEEAPGPPGGHTHEGGR